MIPVPLAKTRKQANQRRTDEWIQKMGTHTEQYHSAIKRMTSCLAQQQGNREDQKSEVRQRRTTILWYHSEVESKNGHK